MNCRAAVYLPDSGFPAWQGIDLRLDQEVDIEAVDGKIVITPIKAKKE